MPWHKPRFRVVHLIVLVGVVAVEFAAVWEEFAWIMAGLSILSALLASILGPFTKIEWLCIALFHFFVWGVVAP